MIREALTFVADLVRQANEIEKIPDPDNRRSLLFVGGKQIDTLKDKQPARSIAVHDTDSFRIATRRWSDNGVVYISPTQVVCVLNDDFRDETITLKLTQSQQLARLLQLEAKPTLTQADLIRLIRSEVQFANGASLLSAARKVKFASSTSGMSDIQHGSQSMGKTIENAVAGIDSAFPEAVTAVVPIFANRGLVLRSSSILCDLEPVAAEQSFRLRPLAGAIEAAIFEELEHVASEIDFAGTVLYGSPK